MQQKHALGHQRVFYVIFFEFRILSERDQQHQHRLITMTTTTQTRKMTTNTDFETFFPIGAGFGLFPFEIIVIFYTKIGWSRVLTNIK